MGLSLYVDRIQSWLMYDLPLSRTPLLYKNDLFRFPL